MPRTDYSLKVDLVIEDKNQQQSILARSKTIYLPQNLPQINTENTLAIIGKDNNLENQIQSQNYWLKELIIMDRHTIIEEFNGKEAADKLAAAVVYM